MLATFKPTIPPTGIPVFSPAAAATKGPRLIYRFGNTLKASTSPAAPLTAAPLTAAPRSSKSVDAPASPPASSSPSDGPAAGEDDSSCSDDEISDVLDETEIQLIEAMEDTRIAGPKSRGPAAPAASPPSSAMLLPRRPLCWVGPGESAAAPRASFAESLKERFAAPRTASPTTATTAAAGNAPILRASGAGISSLRAPGTGIPSLRAATNDKSRARTDDCVRTNSARAHVAADTKPEEASAAPRPVSPAPESRPPADTAAETTGAPGIADEAGGNACLGAGASTGADAEDVPPPAAQPDAVEFVAPGVAKQTATSLLRRVLDIDSPTIQQKMVEFLLIDGVIASLIGFITHCQGSIYSPSPDALSAPGSPLPQRGAAGGDGSTSPAASGRCEPASPAANSEHQLGVIQEAERRRQRRLRLMRQRGRSAGLAEADLRRAFNAVNMLTSRDQHARRVVEAKLSVIVPCLMAVFHVDSHGSFHHVCMLLEHCFAMSPLKTTRLLLYQQNPPSRWWQHSESVAKGHAPICDILPYLSEPCVQRLFLKAEFGVWSGRLMVSLNLSPNDAVVVSDELSRIGLGPVASALGSAPADDSATGKAQSQQRSKAMQLVRNRFQQLNRGGFLAQAFELVEDPDPETSESVAEFLAFMINDCSTFYGFNILFKPIYDSELPVRRLAQLIVNSPAQRLTPQAKSATRLLHALLSKTSCQYGLRTREAQGIRDHELHPRGSQVLVHVGHAARSALESFLPGLFATVAGQQENIDLTSHSACNRRASAESLQLPEYDEADRELDVDLTEAESSDSESSEASADSDDEPEMPTLDLGERQQPLPPLTASSAVEQSSGSDSDSDDGCKDADLRSSAAALLQATYPESIASGSVSSSLSPSSTLSASPMAIASSTPERPLDTRATERLDAEDLDLLATLPKPDLSRLNLLQICTEVLRECEDVDEIVGWIDLRVWRALGTWFLNHPHNNMLHMSVYQLLSMVSLEAVRLRKARRERMGSGLRAAQHPPATAKPPMTGYMRLRKRHGLGGDGSGSGSGGHGGSSMSAVEASDYLSADAQSSCAPEPQAQLAAKRRALRRRAAAERLRREEASNCDKVLTYLVEQYRWIDKLVRRATSPNFDGAHGYISLILNTLRLAVQVDRRRPTGAAEPGKPAARPTAARPAGKRHTKAEQPASPAGGGRGDCAAKGPDEPHSEASDSEAMLPDLAYHDPATRERLSEYPLYRLQRWEISLLYSPAFRAHLPALRQQALLMARKIVEFKLCDSAHRVISSESDGTGQRPVPYFSPQKVQPPLVLDNTDLKKKRLQINVELLLGDRCAAALSPSSSRAPPASASASSSLAAALAHGAPAKGKAGAELPAPQPVDEVGININSLFARMLGFTEDLVGLPHVPAAAGDSGAAKSDKAAAVAEPLPGDGADVVTDEEGGARGHDGDRDTKTRKSGASGYSKTGSSRWKKSKPALGTPASGLFEDVGPETASEAAEAICSALVSEGGGGSRHAPSSRTRKKPATASGTVRRRRARLQRRLSASSLTDAASGQPSPDAAAPAAHASDAPSLPARDASAPAGLAHSMQSLDLEQ